MTIAERSRPELRRWSPAGLRFLALRDAIDQEIVGWPRDGEVERALRRASRALATAAAMARLPESRH